MYVKVDWQHTAEDFHALFGAERDGKLRQRYQAFWLVCEGRLTLTEIAHLVGATKETVIRWLNWYRAGGLAAVQAHRLGVAGGVVARLSLAQQDLLAAEAGFGGFRSIEEAQTWIREQFGISYTYWGARSLLDRLNIQGKVPRPVHPKADPDAQAAWKKGA